MNEFIDLVARMRNAQSAFFRARKSGNDTQASMALIESKKLERQVDDFVEKFKAEKQQPKLF